VFGLQSVSRCRGLFGPRGRRALRPVVLAGALLTASLALAVPSAIAASTPTVNLGHASTYAVLSGTSVGNTVSAPGAPHTTLRGDLGVNADTQPTGFPPGVVTGATRVGTTAGPGYTDLVSAYKEVSGRSAGTAIAGDLAGVTLTPGLYSAAGAVSNTGTLTLDGGGDPNAVFVFQVGGALNMAAGANVTLVNGASASHVFWQVNGAAAVGAGANFAGTVMALNAIAVGAGSTVNGRAMSLGGAISLDSNNFYSAPPAVAIDGGATAITNNNTPTISGTTDVVSPGVVTVKMANQTLTATPTGGTWSVTSGRVANATYAVVASVIDGAGNTGTATQQLTINSVPPILTLDGGASVLTNNPTPTISGESNVPVSTVIHVTVGSQKLTALVQPGGTWNVRTDKLTDGTRTVVAAVTDRAGNTTTASQSLTVDTVPPAVKINGGAARLTDDKTPVISGTAAVALGTPVTVTVADQTLIGTVSRTGTWSVTSAALSDGQHRVTMSVSDAAGNQAGATQILTVDTVAPLVTINGGPAATTASLTPTISGTSNAAPGTTVTVTIAGQTMTTLLQGNGTWNATPSFVGDGTWRVVGSAPDPAGNVGIARQNLTIVAPLTLTAFTPMSGPVGTHVTITGADFRSTSTVKFSGAAATVVSPVMPSKLVAVVPASATSGKITVTNTAAPAGTVTSSGSYTVTQSHPPTITSFTPASGITGSSVTITGTFLSGASSVRFGKLAAAYVIVSATQIKATVPNGATTANISVATAVATATSSAVFTPTLSIRGLSPGSGPTGTHVMITGTGFTPTSTVRFNGIPAAVLTRTPSTSLVAVVPAAATSGPITLQNTTTPTGTVTSAGSYKVTPHSPAVISSFTPTSGTTGSVVTITGNFFNGASKVAVGRLSAAYVTLSATKIRATVPNGAGTGKIYVTTAVGIAASSAPFTPTLSITGFTPAGGPTDTDVTITGVGFTPGSTVKVGGVAAPVASRTLSTKLVAVVPATARIGKITVTNTAAPIGTVSSATNYTKS
jgi:hypothetical protein